MNDLKSIGEKVRDIRNAAGQTQEQFAEAIGVVTETVSNIERGTGLMKTENLVCIAETYHVSTDEILGIEFHLSAHENTM